MKRPAAAALVVLLLGLAGLLGGWLSKAPCQEAYTDANGVAQVDWRDNRQYELGCYSDTVPLYGVERLEAGGFPYRTSWVETDAGGREQVRYMEYPVLTGLLQWADMRVTKWYRDAVGGTGPEVATYFAVTALVLSLAWLVALAATGALLAAAGRSRSVLLMALSPLVVVHAFTNFDPLAVALASTGLLAWARRRPVLAGVLLGLGAAAKLYPLLLLGPLLVLCLRTGTLRAWLRAATAAVLGWGAVNLPIAVLYPAGWREFFRINQQRPADHDSVYNVVSVLTGWPGFDPPQPGQAPDVLNLVTLLLFASVCVGVAVLALAAPRRPQVAQLGFLLLAGFLLTNKVWSPQYSLWLVPLAVLAIRRWQPVLLWMALDAVVWVPRMQYFRYLSDQATGLPPAWFAGTVLVRDAAVLGLCALVLRDVLRAPPARPGEPVEDPCGGVLVDAPDLVVPRRRRSAQPRPARAAFAAIASRTYPARPSATSS